MRHKVDGDWQTTTWADYRVAARQVARAFIDLGLEPGKGVAILSFNRPEWFLADVGAILAGGVPTGIYSTSSSEQVAYIARHCEARIIVVEHHDHLTKILEVREQLPDLRAIVLLDGESDVEGVCSWQEILDLGAAADGDELALRTAVQNPDDLCTLIYTSGTTGPPKAVMLSHHNLIWTSRALIDTYELGPGERVISYLPLSHIAEQIVSLHGPMGIGATTWFAESLERMGENLREARPHIFFAVPRVWEKMQAGITEALASAPQNKRRVAAWARKQAMRAGKAWQEGRRAPLLYHLADRLVLSKIARQLGLDAARIRAVAAAPTARSTHDFFVSLGMPIYEVYGQSENTGPLTFSTPDAFRTGAAGWVIPGTELRLAEDGEILARGPHIFLGYLKDPESTAEALDADGWLHTGDIGVMDEDGYLSITDRKKELIITSGGKNISPQNIEAMLKSIPAISQAAAIGDGRKYIAALITLDPERLAREVKKAGSIARTVAEAAADEVFHKYLEAHIERVNRHLSNVESIKRFKILARDFSVATGELTPTMKLKRRVIAENFAREIEALYPPAERKPA
jgi:long-subunit acyl-CoA synthetase (AMP-forming)